MWRSGDLSTTVGGDCSKAAQGFWSTSFLAVRREAEGQRERQGLMYSCKHWGMGGQFLLVEEVLSFSLNSLMSSYFTHCSFSLPGGKGRTKEGASLGWAEVLRLWALGAVLLPSLYSTREVPVLSNPRTSLGCTNQVLFSSPHSCR